MDPLRLLSLRPHPSSVNSISETLASPGSPQQGPSIDATGMSASCQKPTFAVQQTSPCQSTRHSPNGTLWNNVASRHPSGFAPENLTTLAHFSVSSAMSLLKSEGEPANTVPPRSAIRALIRGSVRATLICLLSLSMISVGVFLGAATPNQPLAS